MAAKTVGFAIDPEFKPGLDEVVAHYAHGNRSEFLRIAVRDYQARLRLERMHAIRADVRSQLGGRSLTPDEVMDLIKDRAIS